MNSMLDEEGIKNNGTCSDVRDLLKKQIAMLRANDIKLIGDDTTLVRMIKFFNEYKKKYEEYKRREEKKRKLRDDIRVKPEDEEISRREENLREKKLKPYFYPHLTEEAPSPDKRERSYESSLNSSRLKDPLVIKDRSIEGNDTVYSPQIPETVLFLDDASIPEESKLGSQYYLTEGTNPTSGRKKVTLNLKVPKSKLNNLKNIRAFIRMRDPKTNAVVSKEKSFNLDYVAEEVSVDHSLKKKYHFRKNGENSVKTSQHDRSTELTSNLPSINPDPRTKSLLQVEKLEFKRKLNSSDMRGTVRS